MNLDELRDVQNNERATDSLQELRDSFYADVADYIQERKAERDRLASEVDDPFGNPDISRLTDEIETAEQVAEAIYERRVGKVVKQASFAAADMAGDEDGLTAEERELYTDLVERIGENKSRVLAVLAGEERSDGDAPSASRPADAHADGGSTDVTETAPTDEGPSVDAADLMGGDAADSGPADATGGSPPGPESDAAGSGTVEEPPAAPDGPAVPDGSQDAGASAADSTDDDPDRATVRITRDVGEIFGVDERVYSLEAEDVVVLPEANARPLLDRDAAERLEPER